MPYFSHSFISSRCLLVLVVSVAIVTIWANSGFVQSKSGAWLNGFELMEPLVPIREIHHGGPPKDGIPAIDNPKFLTSNRATFLKGDDRVLGLEWGGEAKAYPIKVLIWHEIVNDQLAGDPVVVTYCPLCGTGMAFNAELDGKALSFGVSGLLYNSDMLLYDRETESLWSQLMMRSVSGEYRGTPLTLLALRHTTWADWKSEFPATKVLSTNTGFTRNYNKTPYLGYEQSPALYFPVSKEDKRFHPKEMVMGVRFREEAKAYSFSVLENLSAPILDTLASQPVEIFFDTKNRSAHIETQQGEEIPSVMAYWFAWYAFNPETEVYDP